MDEADFLEPRLVGRGDELGELGRALDRAVQGNGATVLLSGEAGIGKTRLVNELLEMSASDNVHTVKGWCLAENLEPLMPVKTALREAGLFHLISGEPPPLVVSAYLMNDAGMLILKAEREESDLDPDIFTSMLKAVGDFVRDSLSMMGKAEGGGLNSLGYERFRILVQSSGTLSLATVIEGSESEFLIQDMQRTLADIGTELDAWDGDPSEASDYEPKVTWFIESGKYDGRFLVDSPAIIQENLFDNVLLGLQRMAASKPLVLFLDDLQWADPSTLGLLHYLARNTRSDRILILGTYRPEDVMGRDGAPHPLDRAMQEMGREGLFERMELRRLDPEDTGLVVSSLLGRAELEPGFLDRIYRDTGGTPLFILEVIRLLTEDGTLERDAEGTWRLAAGADTLDIPSKVFDVVKRRLDRLMREQREILECASVVGEEFGSDVVSSAAGIDRLNLLKNLGEIERSHRLIHSYQKNYVFDHAKVREVLYNGIIAELRQEYHRLIAETMLALRGDAAVNELAYHFSEAGDPRAGPYLITAGDSARDRYANEEAIRLYTKAADFVDEARRLETWEKTGDIEFMLGEYDRAHEYYSLILAKTDDPVTDARIMRKIGEFQTRRGQYEDAVSTFTSARELLDEGDAETARLLVSEGYTYYFTGEYNKAMGLFLKALMVFGGADAEPADTGKVLRAIGNIHYLKGEYEMALDFFGRSLEVMEDSEDIQGIAAALNNIGVVHNDRGELDKALEYYERSLEIVSKTGAKTFIAQALNNIGIVYNSTGELGKALEYHQRGLEMEQRSGDSRGIAESMNNLGVVYVDMGEREKALEHYLGSLEIRERIGDRRGIGFSYYNVGNSYAHTEDYAKAEEYYLKSLDICTELGDDSMKVYNLSGLAAAAIQQGDLDKALAHAGNAVETAVSMDHNLEIGMGRRVLGMVYRELKDWNRAGKELEKAVGALQNVDARKLLGETVYEQAQLYRAMGEPEKARAGLTEALEMFDGMGLVEWKARTERALEELDR